MKIPQHKTAHAAHGTDPVIHLLAAKVISDGVAPEPQTVIEEIWARATWVGPVMEGILHESHADMHLRQRD